MGKIVNDTWRQSRNLLGGVEKCNVLCVFVRSVFQKYNKDTRALCQPGGKTPQTGSGKEAFKTHLKSGMVVFAQGAAATPTKLLNDMTDVGKAASLKGIKVYHMHTEQEARYADPESKGVFRQCSLFVGGNVRKALTDGRADAIPIFLQDIPKLFHRKLIKPDIAIIHVTPPDCHGYCTLGTSVDCVRAAVTHSKVIIAQVNEMMPRTFGDTLIHYSHIDFAVSVNAPLPDHKFRELKEDEAKIGKLIAENLVEDGATLQMGIGAIPDAALSQLHNHKDLGIHSEMFSLGLIDLVKKGCVTNKYKKQQTGRIVGSFLVGNSQLYEFVHDNPSIELLEIDYVNNTYVVSKQPKMTAINSCLEVDITGQVCSDSIGTRIYSGFGGQVDFIRGAAEGLDGRGKPIIAMVSITKKGISKIVPTLKVGAGVVTTRAHAQYIVTENGIAYLFGKNLRQRAHALIKIAHPTAQEGLEKAAFERFKVMPSPD